MIHSTFIISNYNPKLLIRKQHQTRKAKGDVPASRVKHAPPGAAPPPAPLDYFHLKNVSMHQTLSFKLRHATTASRLPPHIPCLATTQRTCSTTVARNKRLPAILITALTKCADQLRNSVFAFTFLSRAITRFNPARYTFLCQNPRHAAAACVTDRRCRRSIYSRAAFAKLMRQ